MLSITGSFIESRLTYRIIERPLKICEIWILTDPVTDAITNTITHTLTNTSFKLSIAVGRQIVEPISLHFKNFGHSQLDFVDDVFAEAHRGKTFAELDFI